MQFKRLLSKLTYNHVFASINRRLHIRRINTYKKSIHDSNIVWHTCTPKSASTFFMNYSKAALANSSKNFTIIQGVPIYENRPQIICESTIIKSLNKTSDINLSSHQHVLATNDLLDKITDNHVVICQYRSILDTIVSLIDHQDDKQKSMVNLFAPFSHCYWEQLSYEEKLNNIIDNYLPWHISYLQGWIIASETINVKWLHYNDVILDPKKSFNQIFSKFNISSPDFVEIPKSKSNFNKGISGRGKKIIPKSMQERITEKILRADKLNQNLINYL
jgi:hypothetical protein